MNQIFYNKEFQKNILEIPKDLGSNVFIIDDFTSNCESMRTKFDKSKFNTMISSGGFRYNYAKPMKTDVLRSLDEMDRITGFNLAEYPCTSFYVYETTDDETFTRKNTWIHFDVWKCVAIHYLNTPLECSGGTNFYSHKQTGINKFTRAEVLNQPDLAKIFRNSSIKTDDWNCDLEVKMNWNRLIIFNPNYFHSPAFYFGSDISNARKYQVFAFS